MVSDLLEDLYRIMKKHIGSEKPCFNKWVFYICLAFDLHMLMLLQATFS